MRHQSWAGRHAVEALRAIESLLVVSISSRTLRFIWLEDVCVR